VVITRAQTARASSSSSRKATVLPERLPLEQPTCISEVWDGLNVIVSFNSHWFNSSIVPPLLLICHGNSRARSQRPALNDLGRFRFPVSVRVRPLLPVVNDRFETTKIDSVACETYVFVTHVDSSA